MRCFCLEGNVIQVIVFVPEKFKESVKTAMFNAGAGRMGNYDFCCFEHQGVGQFRPLSGSQAFVGTVDVLERVLEFKIEMICEEHLYENVIAAMKAAHPYETPAYYGIKTVGI
jgi:hypothetical protein